MPNTNSNKIPIALLATATVLYAGATWSFVTKDSHDDLVIEKPKEASPAATAGQAATTPDDDIKQKQQKQKDTLRDKNMFFVQPKPGIPQISGILGDKAYYNGEGKKVGDRIGPGAEIIEITNMYVKLKYEGNDIMQYPINAPSLPIVPPKPKPEVKQPETAKAADGPAVVAKVPQKSEEELKADKEFEEFGLSSHYGPLLRPLWDKLPQEEKTQMLEQFRKMTQSQRDAAILSIQQAYDSGALD